MVIIDTEGKYFVRYTNEIKSNGIIIMNVIQGLEYPDKKGYVHKKIDINTFSNKATKVPTNYVKKRYKRESSWFKTYVCNPNYKLIEKNNEEYKKSLELGYPHNVEIEYDLILDNIDLSKKWILLWSFGENMFTRVGYGDWSSSSQMQKLSKLTKNTTFFVDNIPCSTEYGLNDFGIDFNQELGESFKNQKLLKFIQPKNF